MMKSETVTNALKKDYIYTLLHINRYIYWDGT